MGFDKIDYIFSFIHAARGSFYVDLHPSQSQIMRNSDVFFCIQSQMLSRSSLRYTRDRRYNTLCVFYDTAKP